ncbi:MAG TPA: GNAT family N-acetyltransferase [Jatrophihabitans sp.]|nr:GNAT family N-acetyltransferase [Jatrophihabitans sp.]
MAELELRKNEAEGRYESHLDGHRIGLATYHRRGDVVVLPHTETEPAYGGRGFAGRLVRFALEDIRSQGLRVDPACPFVADYLAAHPEFADLAE